MFRVYFLLSLIVTSQQYSINKSVKNEIPNDGKEVLDTKGVIRKLKSEELPVLPVIGEREKREVFWYEQTVAVRDSDEKNGTLRCEIVEVYESEKIMEALHNLTITDDAMIKKITMDKMTVVMKECDAIDGSQKRDNIEYDKNQAMNELDDPLTITQRELLNGIVPGTKWCGFGDIAERYHDLGRLRDTDRCCRAHDLCPVKILSQDERYNLTNSAIYTKSNCLCDEAFYDCLKDVNGWMSNIIGNIYFKLVAPECIKGLPDIPEPPMELVPATRSW